MNEDDRNIHNELTEPHRSHAAKIAWKRHRPSYDRANRKKERDNMKFYTIAKDLEECLKSLDEADIIKDDVFDSTLEVDFETVAGGVGFKIDKETSDVSFSTTLSESKRGAYRLLTEESTDIETLYDNLKQDIKNLTETFDSEMKNILSKYGLKET